MKPNGPNTTDLDLPLPTDFLGRIGLSTLTLLTLSNSKAFEEEDSLRTSKIVPFLLQDKLIERGAIHVHGKAWEENVVVENRLITGQNPASAKKVAQSIITLFEK